MPTAPLALTADRSTGRIPHQETEGTHTRSPRQGDWGRNPDWGRSPEIVRSRPASPASQAALASREDTKAGGGRCPKPPDSTVLPVSCNPRRTEKTGDRDNIGGVRHAPPGEKEPPLARPNTSGQETGTGRGRKTSQPVDHSPHSGVTYAPGADLLYEHIPYNCN